MGGLCPKTALPIRAPWGETAPQYEGTVALDEYPFGKRLFPNVLFAVTNQLPDRSNMFIGYGMRYCVHSPTTDF